MVREREAEPCRVQDHSESRYRVQRSGSIYYHFGEPDFMIGHEKAVVNR